jgi:Fe2+ transport system protein FeoA
MALPLIFKSKTTTAAPGLAVKDTLDQVKPGSRVVVLDFGRIDPVQKDHLQAYGLTPGREMLVLQQRPVTVVQIEYTELAFEKVIAEQIFVIKAA